MVIPGWVLVLGLCLILILWLVSQMKIDGALLSVQRAHERAELLEERLEAQAKELRGLYQRVIHSEQDVEYIETWLEGSGWEWVLEPARPEVGRWVRRRGGKHS